MSSTSFPLIPAGPFDPSSPASPAAAHRKHRKLDRSFRKKPPVGVRIGSDQVRPLALLTQAQAQSEAEPWRPSRPRMPRGPRFPRGPLGPVYPRLPGLPVRPGSPIGPKMPSLRAPQSNVAPQRVRCRIDRGEPRRTYWGTLVCGVADLPGSPASPRWPRSPRFPGSPIGMIGKTERSRYPTASADCERNGTTGANSSRRNALCSHAGGFIRCAQLELPLCPSRGRRVRST